ncbi:MAG: sigma-70 family RNA polymerase sigma factor [Planctomycetia bacterium]|nr:sigma-70 family RNA polymerase sigma factor [Planctomycetia bacterium]
MEETAGVPGPDNGPDDASDDGADDANADGPDRIASLLVEWQSTGCQGALERLIAATLSTMRACAARTLRRQGIADKSSVDDAVSLVLDHLRRLPRTTTQEAAVAPFAAVHGEQRGAAANRGAGTAYLLWLARERAIDVARARRRRDRRAMPLSVAAIDPAAREPTQRPDKDSDLLLAVLSGLEPRLRTVVEQLLDGTTQTEIARLLGVCEGTVSRLRGRAIAELRRLMRE